MIEIGVVIKIGVVIEIGVMRLASYGTWVFSGEGGIDDD